MAVPEWKMGKVDKTDIGRSIREKIQKAVSSIGAHRDIDRLSKINNEKKLEEEINKMAATKYASGSKEYLDYAYAIYSKIKKIRFERENKRILKNLYSAVQRFKAKKMDIGMLSEECAIFYKEALGMGSYGNFVGWIVENEIENLDDYLDELNSKVLHYKNTRKITINNNSSPKEQHTEVIEIPARYRDFMKETKDMITYLVGRGKRLKNQYMGMCDKLINELVRRGENREEVLTSVNSDYIMPLSGASLSSPSQQNMLKDLWKSIFSCNLQNKKEYRRLFYNLKEGVTYNTAQTNPKELGELTYFIYLMYYTYDRKKLNEVYNSVLNEFKSKIRRAEAGDQKGARVKKIVSAFEKKEGVSEENNSTTPKTENGSRVAELRKIFEKEPIVGVRKNR